MQVAMFAASLRVVMTAVSVAYICIAQIGLNLPLGWNRAIGATVIAVCAALFFHWKLTKCRK